MERRPKALIFGITGQDGSLLAEYLLNLGYEVHGVVRRNSAFQSFNTERIECLQLFELLRDNLHYGDITDALNVFDLISTILPDEIYNLAAMSHVHVSFQQPVYTTVTDGLGTLHILESIRRIKELNDHSIKMYQANTSEMFGGSEEDYTSDEWSSIETQGMKETTRMCPKSPYGCAKLLSHHLVAVYRSSYSIFAVSGICFNHESHMRDPRFVTRKVTQHVAKLYQGVTSDPLVLGNLDAKRDWGYAGDFVRGMHMSLQQTDPDDFVFATGETHSVRELVEVAFSVVGWNVEWKGSGMDTIGVDSNNPERVLVRVCSKYYRPNEVHFLKGCSDKAQSKLNWKPSVSFKAMIQNMVNQDISKY